MVKKLLFLIALCMVLVPTARTRAGESALVGYLLFEYYDEVPGSTVADLYAAPIYPFKPTEVEWRDSFEGPTNRAENYGTRAGGYVIPPQTGAYTFWIASDDASELWLSPDIDYAKSAPVARVTGWASPRQWTKDPNQQSAPIELVAGQMYYIEVVHKEGGSGDNMAVAWAGPGIGDSPTVIDGQYLSPYITGADDPLIVKYYKARVPSPTDQGFAGSTEPLLTWAPIVCAQSYQIYLSTSMEDVTSGAPAANKGRVTTNAYQARGLALNTTYYWRVDGWGAENVVYGGKVWSFTVSARTASQPTPPDGILFAAPNVSLSWTAGMGAIQHHLYLGLNPDDVVAGAASADKGILNETSFVPGTLERGKKYYWRVDEIDAAQTNLGTLWSFQVEYDVPVTDPNLIGWWKFEEGAQRAIDWSGHGNNGALHGDPVWVPSEDGMALDYDGQGDYLDTGRTATQLGLAGNAPRTVSAWVLVRKFNGAGIYEMGSNLTQQDFSLTTRSGANNRWRLQYWKADVDFDMKALNQWVHVTHTHDGTNTRIYADGQLLVTHPVILSTGDNKTFKIGAYRSYQFDGIIDDVRLYNRALAAEDIAQIMRGNLLQAWAPSPARYAQVDAERTTELSFNAGDGAVLHDVYLGTSAKAVTEGMADANLSPVYQGRREVTRLPVPGPLELGATYYWRIDEIDAHGVLTKGKTWSFDVVTYLIVDDFEAYDDDSSRIFQTWKDGFGYTEPAPGYAGNGTGSAVGNSGSPFMETGTVHGGQQAMPFSYDNSGTSAGAYSETSRDFAVPQDFTRRGAEALSVAFYGDRDGMVRDTFYVALQDAAGKIAVVRYDNVNALVEASWHEWSIPLSSFAGVDAKAIATIYLGVGDRDAPKITGAGRILIDDIRLETQ